MRGAIEVAITGDPSDERFASLAATVSDRYLPSLVLAGGLETDDIALLEGRGTGVPMAYVCRAYACDAPTSDVAVLGEQLDAITHSASQLVE